MFRVLHNQFAFFLFSKQNALAIFIRLWAANRNEIVRIGNRRDIQVTLLSLGNNQIVFDCP